MIISSLLTGKAVAVVGAGVIVLSGGTAAAAYAGVLPSSLQDVAHTVVGAPASEPTADPSGEPSESAEPSDSGEPSDSAEPSESADPSHSPEVSESPDPSMSAEPSDSPSPSTSTPEQHGHSAWGLCNAYLHGGLPQNSQGYAKLVALAGTGTVDAFCATVTKPGAPKGGHKPGGSHHGSTGHGHGNGNGPRPRSRWQHAHPAADRPHPEHDAVGLSGRTSALEVTARCRARTTAEGAVGPGSVPPWVSRCCAGPSRCR